MRNVPYRGAALSSPGMQPCKGGQLQYNRQNYTMYVLAKHSWSCALGKKTNTQHHWFNGSDKEAITLIVPTVYLIESFARIPATSILELCLVI